MYYRLKVLVLCLVLLLTSIGIVPSVSFACSCAKPISVKEEFERSNAVFSGKVIQIKEQKNFEGYVVKKILFDVNNTWKGVSESQIIIVTGQGGGDCGYNFILGKIYLVYAYHSSLYGDKLSTGTCDLTKMISNANKDLSILGEGKAPTKEVNLQNELNNSRVFTYLWISVIGIMVLIALIVWRRLKK